MYVYNLYTYIYIYVNICIYIYTYTINKDTSLKYIVIGIAMELIFRNLFADLPRSAEIQDGRPGPGDYAAVKQTLAGGLSVASSKTMGVPPVTWKKFHDVKIRHAKENNLA